MDCYLSQLLKMVNELSSLENIKTTVDALSETIGSLSSTVETLNSSISGMIEDVSSIKDDVGDVKDDMSTVKDDVSTVKTNVGTIKDDVSTVKDDVSTVKDNVDTVITGVNSIGADIKYVLSALQDLVNREDYTDYFATGTVVLDVSDNDGYLAYMVNLGEYFSVGYTIYQMNTADQETPATLHSYQSGNFVYIDNSTYLKMKPEPWCYKGEDHYNFIVELTNSAVEEHSELVKLYVIGRFATRTKCYILTESQYELLDNNEFFNPYKLTYPLTLPSA